MEIRIKEMTLRVRHTYNHLEYIMPLRGMGRFDSGCGGRMMRGEGRKAKAEKREATKGLERCASDVGRGTGGGVATGFRGVYYV